MLVNLCDYKQSVTLIANSGVQFLDFGLTPQDTASNGRFVRKTANGPLLRLDFDLVNGRYTLPAADGGQPEVVKPESTIAKAFHTRRGWQHAPRHHCPRQPDCRTCNVRAVAD